MITECYIKGRFDYGVGKCAVVITEDVPRDKEKTVLHQMAWKVPESWEYNGETIAADQYNCEILAACYALQWCKDNDKRLVNIYANTKTAYKWYECSEFPEGRTMGAAYKNALEDYCKWIDEREEKHVNKPLYAETIAKSDSNVFNMLVNELAENVR